MTPVISLFMLSFTLYGIVRTPPPGRGESEKSKRGWKYGAEAILLKRGLALVLFNFFKVYHFYI